MASIYEYFTYDEAETRIKSAGTRFMLKNSIRFKLVIIFLIINK